MIKNLCVTLPLQSKPLARFNPPLPWTHCHFLDQDFEPCRSGLPQDLTVIWCQQHRQGEARPPSLISVHLWRWTLRPPISLCPYRGQGRSLKSIGPPRPASASSRLMMIDMAASSLPCSLLCPVSFSVDSCSAMTPSIRLVSAEVLATDPATKSEWPCQI